MQKKSSKGSKIANIIFILFVIIALKFIYDIYKENYYGDFVKAEYTRGLSSFKRDRRIKYDKVDSYKIESREFNDAMFSKKIAVTPNTPYRVSCMIKTENVLSKKNGSGAGAAICIADTTESSRTINGTSEWRKVELMFNSKSRTEVQIGFRLGSNEDNCTGTAWFSDLKLEIGSNTQDTNWKMVCFIFENLDVTIEKDGTKYNVKQTMTASDIQAMKDNMARAKNSFKNLSNYLMTMDYEIIEITEPITSISYNDENGYFVSPLDVSNLIQKYIDVGEYDYIFSAVKFGGAIGEQFEGANNWIGLGGMSYQDMGFSNIRLPNDENSYIYKYDTRVNLFPEEAFIHEFLHTLERISEDNGYKYPLLHDYEKYGYKNEAKYGLKKWYEDYMSKNIIMSHEIKVGIDSNVYSIKPIHKDAFTYSRELQFDNSPRNVIEEIRAIFGVIVNTVKNIGTGEAREI